eukprot:55329-Pelagomonas_calceolata.AAC.1
MLPLCRLQLLPRPRISTLFNLYQVYVPPVHTYLMGLSNVGSCLGPVWGAVHAVLHGVTYGMRRRRRRRRRRKKKG